MKPNFLFKSIIFFGLTTSLSACGVTGTLEDAPPMWGKAKAEYEAKKLEALKAQKQKAEDEAAKSNK
ncbi:MAG: hypothetical protein J0L55_15855 [Caulobacterales bacterium]|nr:hypothetical protein [Caulobacterales bacterium]